MARTVLMYCLKYYNGDEKIKVSKEFKESLKTTIPVWIEYSYSYKSTYCYILPCVLLI